MNSPPQNPPRVEQWSTLKTQWDIKLDIIYVLIKGNWVHIYWNIESKAKKIFGCKYKHPEVPVSEFANDFLSPQSDKLNQEKRNTSHGRF